MADFIDGVSPGTLVGMKAVVEGGGTFLRTGGEGVWGDLVWLDLTKYDEAIFQIDSVCEGAEMRTQSVGWDERSGCEVSCWAYLRTH